MIDWDTRPQDMANVDPAPRKPALWWADLTFYSCGAIGVVLVLIARFWR